MKDTEITIFKNNNSLAQAAAKDFQETVVSAVNERGIAYVAFSGGSTPRSLFKLLAQPPFSDMIPWDKIHFFWADERLVDPTDSESNYGQVQQLLFQHVAVDPEKIHPAVEASLTPETLPEEIAQHYADTFKQFAPKGRQFPRLDWLLLGMGADGHTASLFPGSETDPAEVVIAVEANYEGRPVHRVSLTPRILNESRQIVFLVSGVNKADILLEVLHGMPDPVNLPAQRIHPNNGRLVWMVDKAAAVNLE
ncbi:MAG: 6-phosphogluconolactonase [Anaerolineaceae bacterium]|nr:6-phosphogluconolactonase [Anaerolineaceae bacterium]